MARTGRPTKFSAKLAEEICNRVAGGETLSEICRRKGPGVLNRKTIIQWFVRYPDFNHAYMRAFVTRLSHASDEIISIAEDGTNDFIERLKEDGAKTLIFNREHVERSKMRIDARKWLMTKLLPHQYGDRVDLTNSDGSFADSLMAARTRISEPEVREKLNGGEARSH